MNGTRTNNKKKIINNGVIDFFKIVSSIREIKTMMPIDDKEKIKCFEKKK